MSGSEERKPVLELTQFEALEAAVARVLRQLEVWRERAASSESERRRLQAIIDGMETVSADLEVSEVVAEVERLRTENAKLREKLSEGRRQAEQLASEVEFLEDISK